MATDKLMAEWYVRAGREDYTVRLIREPIIAGQPHEYTLVAIDGGKVRRVEITLCRRLGLERLLDPEDAWVTRGAPANAARILRRFKTGHDVA